MDEERLKEAVAHLARCLLLKPGFDDGERSVRKNATPMHALDPHIKLAFAVLQDLRDRFGEFAPNYCDVATETGRCIQVALRVATEHQQGRTRLGVPETLAASIVIEQINNFLLSKPARKRNDERSQLYNRSSLFLLGGVSSYDLAEKLDCDPSFLRRRLKNDLDEIEHIFGHFCKGNKGLRRQWQKPQKALPMWYTAEDEDREPLAAYAALTGKSNSAICGFGVDPEFDDLFDALTETLFIRKTA
jgi:hypothetical protein